MVLVSCQSVKFAPKRTSDSATMLVIPLEIKNQSDRQPYFLVDFKYDGSLNTKTGNLVNFDNDYGFITELTAGPHKITRMIIRWEPTGQVLQQWDRNIPFTLSEGQFTILPVRFSVTMKKDGDYFTHYNLFPEQVAEVRADLGRYRNIEGWTEALP
jgi:hypothetical protein